MKAMNGREALDRYLYTGKLPKATLFEDNRASRIKVLRNFESFFNLSPAPLNLSSNMFEKVQENASQAFLRKELSELVPLEKNDTIMSVELLGYKPTVQLINPDTGELD